MPHIKSDGWVACPDCHLGWVQCDSCMGCGFTQDDLECVACLGEGQVLCQSCDGNWDGDSVRVE